MGPFGKDRTLFRLFGLPIKANVSWLFLVALIIVSLAQGWFPRFVGRNASWQLRYGLAVLGAIGLFASLIVHELCHSLVARHTGMPVSGITLFVFGGVSQLEDEPPTAGAEFFMAVVGPLASVVIGVMLGGLWLVGKSAGWPIAALAIVGWLAIVNFLLAAFNSLPAFPLDGGRVLRSIVWGITGSLHVATQVAVSIGSVLGFGLMLVGIMLLVWLDPIGGVWLIVIGFFVRQAALGNLQMVEMRHYLEGERVGRFMTTNLVTVPPDMNLQQFVDEIVFHHRFTYYPVVDGAGGLLGIVSARAPREVPVEDWRNSMVRRIMRPVTEDMTFHPDDDAVEALAALRRLEDGRAVVVEGGKPVGIVSLRDLLGFLALKIDLEPGRRTYRA